VLGDRGWAFAAAIGIELLMAGVGFAATAVLEDDRYGCGFALWIVVITLISPLAWPQFLVCIVPLYVGIAWANHEIELPRRVLNLTCASYVAALFMGGPLGFLSRALARSCRPRRHLFRSDAPISRRSRVRLFRGALDVGFCGGGSNNRRAHHPATQEKVPGVAHVSN
jgi:hypothetical protein